MADGGISTGVCRNREEAYSPHHGLLYSRSGAGREGQSVFRGFLAPSMHPTSWPPSEAAIQRHSLRVHSALDGRVKPGHGVEWEQKYSGQTGSSRVKQSKVRDEGPFGSIEHPHVMAALRGGHPGPRSPAVEWPLDQNLNCSASTRSSSPWLRSNIMKSSMARACSISTFTTSRVSK